MNVEDSYNIWAEQYDSNKNKTRDLDKIATETTLAKYSFETVIELGCGTGKNTKFFITKAKKVVGLDFSDEMLNLAKEKFHGETKVEFHKTDLTKDWNIDEKTADLITCNLVLEHIQDLDCVFAQAFKKLKSGGLFFISELHPFKQYMGSKARFEDKNGTHFLETYTHHTSEFLTVATLNNFELLELKEWFDNDLSNPIPRILSLVFRKKEI